MSQYSIRLDDFLAIEPGDYAPYYDTSMVRRGEEYGRPGVKWIPVEMPELLSGSDYMGASYTVSNHRVFTADYGEIPGVYQFRAGYGGYGVILAPWALAWVTSGDPVTDYGIDSDRYSQFGRQYIRTIRDELAQLEDYPVLDDSDLSDVERESEDSAWESWARRDAERALVAAFPELEDVFDSRELLRRDFEEWCGETDTYWENETGNSAYIDIDRVVRGVTREMLVNAGYIAAEDN